MNIHPVNSPKSDRNRFCGPAVLSIITGMTTGEAARLLRAVTGRTQITGTHTHQMSKAFAKCNVTLHNQGVEKIRRENPNWSLGYVMEWPTLAAWLRTSQAIRTEGRVYLVSAGNHWQIITGRRYCCGRTGEIVSIRDEKVKRRARVNEVYELRCGKLGVRIPAEARALARSSDPFKTSVSLLERQHGFKGKIERSGGYTDYVVPACAIFPRGLSTCHHGWSETLERVDLAVTDYDSYVDESGWLSL